MSPQAVGYVYRDERDLFDGKREREREKRPCMLWIAVEVRFACVHKKKERKKEKHFTFSEEANHCIATKKA